jgi:nucleoside-diphosphate-sugar epimerase
MNLVTGATGLVGSHLLLELLKQEQKVIGTYRNKEKIKHVKQIFTYYNCEDLFSKIQWKPLDLLDVQSCLEVLEDVENVYHCAAKVSFHSKYRNELFKTNIEGTANLVNAALTKKEINFCYVSSVTALGPAGINQLIDENAPWVNKVNPTNYSISKYYAEKEVWRAMQEGLNAIIVNPSTIIGPGNWKTGSPALFNRVYNGLKYYTNGGTGFVDVRDVVKIMVDLIQKKAFENAFILVGENKPFKWLFDKIAEALKVDKPKKLANSFEVNLAWRVEVLRSFLTNKEPVITKESAKIALETDFYDNSKIKNLLNYSFIPIEASIKHTAKCFLMHQTDN